MRTTKDEKIISALLACPTIRAASAACGVGETQIYARLREPEFKQKYAEARRELLEQNTAALQGHIASAVETMAELCTNKKTPAQTRLSAADSIIRNALKLGEQVDIETRLAALEAKHEQY